MAFLSRIRLWPKGLAGQMILLVLLVLVLAQVAGAWFLADERKNALRALRKDVTLERVESVLRLLAETPPILHEKVTTAASGGKIRFVLDRGSIIDPEDSVDTETLWKKFGPKLEPLGVTELRVVVIDLPSFGDGHREDWEHRRDDGMSREHERRERRDRWKRKRPPNVAVFELSLHLKDGRWLNVSHHLQALPFLWAIKDLLTLVGSAAALVLVVVVMIRRITRPVRQLAEASDALGRGEDVPPLAEGGAVEIRNATRAFNQMNQRLKRFMKDRLAILAALSHDLRTPITSLRLRAEFIEDAENRDKILETLDEISEMTEATLSFVREDATRKESRMTDFTALVETVCEDLGDIGKRVTFISNGRAVLSCRPVAVKRALRNLIENADKYGNGAEVSLHLIKGTAEVHVEDSGPGIPEEKMEEVFSPFVRLEESRSRDTGGIGMGLAIARMIIRGHGGDIRLENRAAGGLRVIVSLPMPD